MQATSPADTRAALIRLICLRRGMHFGELAHRAGVSRTTLYQLANGATRRPHAATLAKIAAVLGVDPQVLAEPSPLSLRCNSRGEDGTPSEHYLVEQLAFDRCTNNFVAEVYNDRPRLFVDWTASEWAELYSTFGTGGQLSRQGVVEVAERMNARRELVRKLHVVLETHLSQVAVNTIETLFEAVQARPIRSSGNLHTSERGRMSDDNSTDPATFGSGRGPQ